MKSQDQDFDQEMIERLRKKANEADDPSNWITLTGMTDEQVINVLSGTSAKNDKVSEE